MEEKQTRRNTIKIIITILFVIVAVLFSTSNMKIEVNGTSMNPNFVEGERGLADKYLYKITGLKRFDVVVVKEQDEYFFKRVIALPGEVIEYNSKGLYINGVHYDEDFLDEDGIKCTCNTKAPTNYNPCIMKMTVPENSYFLMGDNRYISNDSRNFGFKSQDEIVGKAYVMLKTSKGKFRFI